MCQLILTKSVDYTKPNKVLTDPYDVRHEIAAATSYHDIYGTLLMPTGGKGFPTGALPLTLADCILPAVQNQHLKPGYKLYMDVQAIGDYYGENRNDEGKLQDLNLYYKMQVTPRYWELNLDTGVYTPVDVYYGTNGTYKAVTKFYDPGVATDWYYYVDWTEESARRNYTAAEKEASIDVQQWMSPTLDGFDKLRLPAGKDVIGTAARLFLNDANRTFVGSTFTYGVDRNPQGKFDLTMYRKQGQRWHFTLGMPSSSVFVPAGEPCTTENIQGMQSHNAVIVCAINILVKGNVWTLEYDGTAINYSDDCSPGIPGITPIPTPGVTPVPGVTLTPTPGVTPTPAPSITPTPGGTPSNPPGIQPEKDGPVFPPPEDPDDPGKPLPDPIIVIYDNKKTAKDDMVTEGTH